MLAYNRTGSGVPLVFLHAFPLSRVMWAAQTPVFSKNFEFITLDLPGFGDSSFSGDTVGMDVMAREVLSTLDQLNLKQKCVVAGLSMGGYVLLQLLAMAPDRFRAAGFFSTRPAADSPEAKEKRFKNIELVQKEGLDVFAERQSTALIGKTTQAERPGVVDRVKQLIRTANPLGVCAALRGMAARPDTTAVLASLGMPALFIAGEEDGIIPPADMEAMSKNGSKSEFHVVPKAGHLINLEQPALFHDLFLHFLKRRVL